MNPPAITVRDDPAITVRDDIVCAHEDQHLSPTGC